MKQRESQDECRCPCGSLLARLCAEGVELKCRRCKRTVLVPLAEAHRAEPRPLEVVPLRDVG